MVAPGTPQDSRLPQDTPPPHCPGCRGYTSKWENACPGVTTGIVTYQRAVGKLPWRLRLKVLAGRPVVTAAGATAYGGGGGRS